MKKLTVQGVDDSPYTSWKITILGPLDTSVVDPVAEAIKKDLSQPSSRKSTDGDSGPPSGCPLHNK